MKSLQIATLAALFLTTLNLGCQSNVYDENKKLWAQNRELQAQKDDLEQRLRAAGDPTALSAMQAELAKRDAEIADLKASLNDNPKGKAGTPGLDGIDATYDPKAG